jgi:hypothetical protein
LRVDGEFSLKRLVATKDGALMSCCIPKVN